MSWAAYIVQQLRDAVARRGTVTPENRDAIAREVQRKVQAAKGQREPFDPKQAQIGGDE